MKTARVKKKTSKTRPRVTVIGGGTGSFNVLSGLRNLCHCHSIVTMMDSGGDSGLLRDTYGVLPPGDARRCIVALSEERKILRNLFSVRFNEEPLKGRNFGNLFFLALRQSLGSDKEAFEAMGRILKIRGKVLPVTYDHVHLVAELENGRIIYGESTIDRRVRLMDPPVSNELFAPIKKVYLEPKAVVNPDASQSIADAQAVIIAPGDVYTSIIPNFLVDGLAEAVATTSAPLIVIVNIMTKRGETDGWSASQHVKEISKYAGRMPDAVLVNDVSIPSEYLQMYQMEYSKQVEVDIDALQKLGNPVVLQEKVLAIDTVIRHDPLLTAKALVRLMDALTLIEK